ncbi:putative translational inhibitor [Marinomonas sp. MED121]|uniref:RidA family protein n=1 Tax=Marinomonas sp. MED121 TaxID=314277 RepID=UPI000068FA91|nr:RidA family protein [Marinomonas sp. MED121]EAQ63924.1 putative translational inhibitor [Marinomonas sp. MED121]
MTPLKINPASLYDGSANGLSHGVVVTSLGLVFVSGQVDWTKDFRVQNSSIEGQADVAMQNLKTVLEAAGSSLEDLLQVRIYVRGEVADHMAALGPVLAKYIAQSRPALTGVGVSSLASPEMLIEIEAIAQLSAS